MAELLVIGYAGPDEAHAALQTVELLEGDKIVTTAGAAVVSRRSDGQVGVTLAGESTGKGAAVGSTAGLLVGILFLVPIGGWIVGGAIGWLAGTVRDWGIGNDFRQQCADLLEPGTSALVVLVEQVMPEAALAALQPLGGTVLRTSLSAEAERELQAALDGRPSGQADHDGPRRPAS
jgi:uncharacterized membrane protein